MKTSAIFACILLPFVTVAQDADSISLISAEALQIQDEQMPYVSSLLTATRDPFATAVAFQFSAMRFQPRGYGADMSGMWINGLPMQDLDNGNTPWALWSGLTEMMRNREAIAGWHGNTFGFGQPGGNTHIDIRAGKQRQQTTAGYAISNRQYTHRFTCTHATGFNTRGWAFSGALSWRYAGEGYAPGTSYHSVSYYAAADKKAGEHHLFSIVLLGAAMQNGRQAATLEETVRLTGNRYYNAYWGYQEGKKRNAAIAATHQPLLLFTHDYHTGDASWITALGYGAGTRGITGLDWYNAADPRPDYYRYLPGYLPNATQKEQLAKAWANDEAVSQVNWNRLYEVNKNSRATVTDADGITGNSITGLRARYVIQERMAQTRRLIFNSVYNVRFSSQLAFTAGVSYQWQRNHYYKQLNDLLGGEFYVDLNQFAERDYPGDPAAAQNDLQHPNRIIREGDRFGYNYAINIHKATAWTQGSITLAKIDFHVAGELSASSFFRYGYMRNGLFPINSSGKSLVNNYTGYSINTGCTYKFSGRHYGYLHAAWSSRPPYAGSSYLSPRTNDVQQENKEPEIIRSVESGYILHAPRLSIKAGAYLTTTLQGRKMLSFYHDEYRSFVNYAISNIGKWHGGTELGIEGKVTTDLTLNAVMAIGRYYYHTRQTAVVTADNNAAILEKSTVYSKNYRLGGAPQEAYSIGIMYRSPDAWFLSVSANYTSQQWLEVNPLRLTVQAIDNVPRNTDQYRDILQQTRWPGQYTVNLFGGYYHRLKNRHGKNANITWNAGVNNLLNNLNTITGGYEQLRFDFATRNRNTFPPKLWYGYGVTCYVSVSIRYQ